MAYTSVWDNTVPLGTAAANTIDNLFRSLKVDISERFDDIFGMSTFVTDPLRPYGLKFTDAQNAVVTFGDNAGTPRAIVYKDKTAVTTYLSHAYTGFTLTPPTLTGASTPFFSVSQTWNNAATTFVAFFFDIVSTASAAGSLLMKMNVDAATVFTISKAGLVTATFSGNLTGNVTGNLTGNVTGNASGTAATVTGATQAAITSAANLATVGTITSGIWNATAVGPTKGGTGLTTYVSGDILYASAADTLSRLAKGANGTFLTLTAGVPAWSATSTADPLSIGTINISTLFTVTDGTHISLNGATDTNYIRNNGGSGIEIVYGSVTQLRIDADATFRIKNGTTANAAELYMGGSLNPILRSTSSIRYKKDVTNFTYADAAKLIFGARGIYYHSKSEFDNPQTWFPGFIAEEIELLDNRFVGYNEEGLVDSVAYTKFAVPIVLVIQNHEQRLNALESQK